MAALPLRRFAPIPQAIYAAYLAARRGKRSRAATAHYEVRLLENIVNLVYILQTKIYRPGVFRVFYVYEPKKRLVQAPAFVDKVVDVYKRQVSSHQCRKRAGNLHCVGRSGPGPVSYTHLDVYKRQPVLYVRAAN